MLYGDITGGTDPIEFKWLTPAGELTIDMIPIENATSAESGIYSFITSDKFHCVDTAWIDLQVVPLPVANFPEVNGTIWFEESYLLEATKGYASYEWSTGDTTWYITVTEEGHYSVILKNEQGCQSMDTVMMMNAMVPVIVPNAFTPNGDGLNDTFKPIVNTELVRQFSMSIYNKWGQLIYETRNASKGWNGEDALPGVYNWVISYENRVGKVSQMKGSVALVR